MADSLLLKNKLDDCVNFIFSLSDEEREKNADFLQFHPTIIGRLYNNGPAKVKQFIWADIMNDFYNIRIKKYGERLISISEMFEVINETVEKYRTK